MSYLKKSLIFFHASFFGISAGSWAIRKIQKILKISSFYSEILTISEFFMSKFLVFWTFWSITLDYAVCHGSYIPSAEAFPLFLYYKAHFKLKIMINF